jgi:hypothetical protein
MTQKPPPRLPPRLRPVPPPPTPKPQPDDGYVLSALAALDLRLTGVETRLGSLFKKSMVAIVATDVLLGLAKMALELLK